MRFRITLQGSPSSVHVHAVSLGQHDKPTACSSAPSLAGLTDSSLRGSTIESCDNIIGYAHCEMKVINKRLCQLISTRILCTVLGWYVYLESIPWIRGPPASSCGPQESNQRDKLHHTRRCVEKRAIFLGIRRHFVPLE